MPVQPRPPPHVPLAHAPGIPLLLLLSADPLPAITACCCDLCLTFYTLTCSFKVSFHPCCSFCGSVTCVTRLALLCVTPERVVTCALTPCEMLITLNILTNSWVPTSDWQARHCKPKRPPRVCRRVWLTALAPPRTRASRAKFHSGKKMPNVERAIWV